MSMEARDERPDESDEWERNWDEFNECSVCGNTTRSTDACPVDGLADVDGLDVDGDTVLLCWLCHNRREA